MATAKNSRATHPSKNGSVGLLANGSCGAWEIAIDEAISGADHWYAQIEGPSVSFYFEIPSVDIVAKMARFLAQRSAGSSDSVVLGKDKKIPITLVKDDEYNDRFFLIVGSTDKPVVRFVLAGTDITNLVEALDQVKEDLNDND